MYDTSVSIFGSQLEIALQRLSFVGAVFLGHSPQKLSLQRGIASKSTDKRRTTNIDKYTEKSGYGIKISRSTLTKKSYLQLDAFVFKGKCNEIWNS